MSRFFSIQRRNWLCLVALIGLITGCASNSSVTLPPTSVAALPIPVSIGDGFQWPDKDLPVRFQQYWTFRRNGDANGSFGYEAPHVREMVIWGKYEGLCKHVRNDWSLIRVEKINNVTDQLITIDFNMVEKSREKEGAKRDVFFRDSWLSFSGRWYHVLKDPLVTGDGFGK